MPTWPTQGWPNGPVIIPWSYQSVGIQLDMTRNSLNAATSQTITQNKAYYVPFEIHDTSFVARQMFVYNGVTVAGNIDLGIYDSQGNRLISKGSTLMAGASVNQYVDITDTTLTPGLYWMAFASDSATATFFQLNATNINTMRGAFIREQATAFALPNPATFAAPVDTKVIVFGISSLTI